MFIVRGDGKQKQFSVVEQEPGAVGQKCWYGRKPGWDFPFITKLEHNEWEMCWCKPLEIVDAISYRVTQSCDKVLKYLNLLCYTKLWHNSQIFKFVVLHKVLTKDDDKNAIVEQTFEDLQKETFSKPIQMVEK